MNITQTTKENSDTNQTFADVCLASCQKLIDRIERAKNNIVAEFKDAFAVHEQLLQRAVNEAAALAWQTEYPHLFFPTLAVEKIQAARRNERRQFLQRGGSV